MKKLKVLFVCVHNSARSQMAEAFLNHLAGDRFEGQSAGLEPGRLNPLAVKVMQEVGIDISGNKTKDVFDFYKRGVFLPVIAWRYARWPFLQTRRCWDRFCPPLRH